MEKCELPHCLQCPSDWRMLFWKSEGLQTGLGKHIVSTLAFYFCPAWLQLHLPAPHTQTLTPARVLYFPSPLQLPIALLYFTPGGLFQTPFVSSISLKHWKATSKKPGSGSPPPGPAAACSIAPSSAPPQEPTGSPGPGRSCSHLCPCLALHRQVVQLSGSAAHTATAS